MLHMSNGWQAGPGSKDSRVYVQAYQQGGAAVTVLLKPEVASAALRWACGLETHTCFPCIPTARRPGRAWQRIPSQYYGDQGSHPPPLVSQGGAALRACSHPAWSRPHPGLA